MSKLMEELMAEVNRVNRLQVEVDKTVGMHNSEIAMDRERKAISITKFIHDIGDILRDVSAGLYGYYPEIPLDVYHNGKQIYINFSVQDNNRFVSIYGGYRGQIQFRVFNMANGIKCDYIVEQHKLDIINALIDQWDEECERKLEYRIAQIIKKKMAERMEVMQKKLADSNEEYAKYFGKDGE